MIYWFAIVAIRFNGAGMEIDCWPQKIKAGSYKEAHKIAIEKALARCPVSEYWGYHKAEGVLA